MVVEIRDARGHVPERDDRERRQPAHRLQLVVRDDRVVEEAGLGEVALDRIAERSSAVRPESQPELERAERAGVLERDVNRVRLVALLGRPELAEDCRIDDSGGFGGIALANNVRSPEEVDELLAQAEKAGAWVTRQGAPTFWGGYSGVFLDPDGHPWEVAHNPFWTLRNDGSVSLSG